MNNPSMLPIVCSKDAFLLQVHRDVLQDMAPTQFATEYLKPCFPVGCEWRLHETESAVLFFWLGALQKSACTDDRFTIRSDPETHCIVINGAYFFHVAVAFPHVHHDTGTGVWVDVDVSRIVRDTDAATEKALRAEVALWQNKHAQLMATAQKKREKMRKAHQEALDAVVLSQAETRRAAALAYLHEQCPAVEEASLLRDTLAFVQFKRTHQDANVQDLFDLLKWRERMLPAFERDVFEEAMLLFESVLEAWRTSHPREPISKFRGAAFFQHVLEQLKIAKNCLTARLLREKN